jgi:hypothetical protein
MTNSQLTVNLSLLTQDQLIISPSPSNMVVRTVPPFVFGSSGAIVYGGYQAMPPNSTIALVPSGMYASFLFVRNATLPVNGQDRDLSLYVEYFDGTTGITDKSSVFPGGLFVKGNPQGQQFTGITEVNLVAPPGGNSVVVEYLFAV